MNQEWLEQGKNNTAKFHRIPTALEVVFHEVGRKNCLMLRSDGSWDQCHCDGEFDPGTRYRIRPDYQPSVESAGYVDYPLSLCGIKWKYNNASMHHVHTWASDAINYKDFIGYISDRGEVMSSRVMYRVGGVLLSWVPAGWIIGKDCVIVEAVAVRFKEEEK